MSPQSANNTLVLAVWLHFFQLVSSVLALAVAVLGYYNLHRRNLQITYVLERVTLVIQLVYNLLVIVQFSLCDLYLYRYAISLFGDDYDKITDFKRTPTYIMVLLSLLLMVVFTLLGWVARKVFLRFRNALERYHTFQSNFEDLPLSSEDKQYLKPLNNRTAEDSLFVDPLDLPDEHTLKSHRFLSRELQPGRSYSGSST